MNKRPIIIYIIISFLFSWSLAAIYYFAGGRISDPSSRIVFMIYMFGPAVGTIAAQKLVLKSAVLKPLGVLFKLNRWYLLAWFFPPLLALVSLLVSLLFPGVSFSPDMAGMLEKYQAILTPEQLIQLQEQINNLPVHPVWLMLAQGLLAGATVNLIAAFGEELGWRGFLFKHLAPLGFWRSSILVGILWGIWHAPLIIQGYNYPQHPGLGVFIMILWCTLLAPLFSFIRQKTGSVIGASLLHGTINGTAGLSYILILGGNDLTTGMLGLPGIIVLVIANLSLYFYQHKQKINTPFPNHQL